MHFWGFHRVNGRVMIDALNAVSVFRAAIKLTASFARRQFRASCENEWSKEKRRPLNRRPIAASHYRDRRNIAFDALASSTAKSALPCLKWQLQMAMKAKYLCMC